jgi:hypothetical protein
MAFFTNEEKELKELIINDTIKRGVGLIAWMEVAEVLPYYCEGLIHLTGLFECGVLEFNDKLKIDINEENYQKLKSWYKKTYLDLAENYYLKKVDPKGFLDKFIVKEDNKYLPKESKVKEFVNWYYALYKEIGQVTL